MSLQDIIERISVKGNGRSAPAIPSPPSSVREQLDMWIAKGSHSVLDCLISPSLAAAMLARNKGNRKLRGRLIERYAEQIGVGDWPLTGQSIIFSDDGILNDGQHRLAACVKAGISFRCDLRFGVPRAAFMQTDIGSKRQTADTFDIMGEKNVTTLASAATLLKTWLDSDKATIHQGYTPSPAECARLLADHPGLRKSAAVGNKIATKIKTSAGVIAWAHYVCTLSDRALAQDFFEKVETGEGLRKGDPALVLRQRLLDIAQARESTHRSVVAAYIIKAWNAAKRGEKIQVLRMYNREQFPEVL